MLVSRNLMNTALSLVYDVVHANPVPSSSR
jgi:hypothetical protein